MPEKHIARRGILSDFFAAHCPRYATSLAYVTLLSLVPLLLFLAYWLSYIAVFNDVGSAFRAFVVGHFIPDSAAVVGDYLDQFMRRIRDLNWINAGLFGGVSLLMVHQLSRAFDHIWGVKRPRSLGLRILLNCLILVLAPVFFGIILLLLFSLESISLRIDILSHAWLNHTLLFGVAFCFEVIVFAFFNWALPSVRVPLRDAIKAGCVAALLFEAAKYGFVLYFRFFNLYQAMYGALSLLPIFLIWLYCSWLIILFSAVYCRRLQYASDNRPRD